MVSRRKLLALLAYVAVLSVVGTALTARSPSTVQPSTKTPSPGLATADPSSAGLSNLTPLIAVVHDVVAGSPGLAQPASDGAKRAAEQFGGEFLEVNGRPDDTTADREARLEHLASTRSSLIFVVGAAYVGPVAKVAALYPATWFGVIDDGNVDAPNVTGMRFHDEQGSFLVGVAAALTSKRGRIGFIGAARVPAQQRFEAGFAAGARAVNPDIRIRVAYLTPPGAAELNDADEAKELASGFYDNGADVIFAVAGEASEGVIQAADERGLWAIGAETDAYLSSDPAVRDSVLTSMLKRADVVTYRVAAEIANDIAKDGTYVFGIGEGAVGYATSGGFVDAIRPQIDAFAARIAAGEILVPTTP